MHRIMRSAAYRIAFLYALGFAGATLALGLVIILASHIALTRQLEGQIVQEAQALQTEYRLEGFREVAFAIREREHSASANELRYAVFAPDGRRITGNLVASRPPLGWSDLSFEDPVEGPDLARSWATDLGGKFRLVVAADKSVVDRVDRQLVVIVLIAFAVILMLSLVGALFLGAYLRRRLSAISQAADRIMAGDLARRVPDGGMGDEFDALALSLNRMLDRIADLVENLRQVSSDVAHDLRTPLARLRAHLEESLDADIEDGLHRQRLEFALLQTDKVLSLFGAILRISEIEDGRRSASFRDFDLSALIDDIADSYILPVEAGGRTLTVHVPPTIIVPGDKELVAQALINLLDNAQIHTAEGTRIVVGLERHDDRASVYVSDDGPGVPFNAQQAIFRRFVRLDPSRSIPGHGLGLNLVAAIVSAHGGTIDVRDNSPGLSIILRLPLKQ